MLGSNKKARTEEDELQWGDGWWSGKEMHEEYRKAPPKICDTVLDHIGNTPLVNNARHLDP